MASIKQSIKTTETKDMYGHVTGSESVISTVSIAKNTEPTYVKMYTNNFNLIKGLKGDSLKIFLILCQYVGYADVSDKAGGQLVKIDKDIKERVMDTLNISTRTLSRGLADLKGNKLIKKIDGTIYQINPFLVGRGFWKFKTDYDSGGIEDLQHDWYSEDNQLDIATRNIINESGLIKDHLKEEIKNAYDLYWAAVRERNGENAEYYQEQINKLAKQLREMDEETYTQYTRYVVEVNNEDIEPLFDEEEEEAVCGV